MKKLLSLVALLLCATTVSSLQAQQLLPYAGEKINFGDHSMKVTRVGALDKSVKQSFQGMDIYGNMLLSLQNTGVATLYDYNGKSLKRLGSFQLGSAHPTNHANLVSFSNTFVEPNDALPLAYISRCKSSLYKGMDKLVFVERVNPQTMTSELVQTIWLNDYQKRFGSYMLASVDAQNRLLYMFAETKGYKHPDCNRHWVLKFRLPEYKGAADSLFVLTEDDALENYCIEDTYPAPYNPVYQGAMVKNNLLFLPTGFGKPDTPSIVYVWNTVSRTMQNVLDLQSAIPHELEDCAIYKGSMVIQTQGEIYKVEFME